MIAEKNPYIKSAYGQLQVISQDKQKHIEYEAREKSIMDYNQGIYEAEQRGKKLGELQTLLSLTRDGIITVSVGAQKSKHGRK